MPQVHRLKTLVKRFNQVRYSDIDEANLAAITSMPPGHFYSPLLDVSRLPRKGNVPGDDETLWTHIDLNPEGQAKLFEELVRDFPPMAFPLTKTEPYRYYTQNKMFSQTDAYTLSALVRKLKPRRIVEVGSGFSSAVMLDTLREINHSAELTFIEPYPERLYSLLSLEDRKKSTIHTKIVQDIPLETFTTLRENDILFIDSSHVAKVGSDVVFLFLKVLPLIAPGVWVHVHDIFYPFSYPMDWLKEGRAWNESLFLKTYLLGNAGMKVTAFNSYAAAIFPQVFEKQFPVFVRESGSSIWMTVV